MISHCRWFLIPLFIAILFHVLTNVVQRNRSSNVVMEGTFWIPYVFNSFDSGYWFNVVESTNKTNYILFWGDVSESFLKSWFHMFHDPTLNQIVYFVASRHQKQLVKSFPHLVFINLDPSEWTLIKNVHIQFHFMVFVHASNEFRANKTHLCSPYWKHLHLHLQGRLAIIDSQEHWNESRFCLSPLLEEHVQLRSFVHRSALSNNQTVQKYGLYVYEKRNDQKKPVNFTK